MYSFSLISKDIFSNFLNAYLRHSGHWSVLVFMSDNVYVVNNNDNNNIIIMILIDLSSIGVLNK